MHSRMNFSGEECGLQGAGRAMCFPSRWFDAVPTFGRFSPERHSYSTIIMMPVAKREDNPPPIRRRARLSRRAATIQRDPSTASSASLPTTATLSALGQPPNRPQELVSWILDATAEGGLDSVFLAPYVDDSGRWEPYDYRVVASAEARACRHFLTLR